MYRVITLLLALALAVAACGGSSDGEAGEATGDDAAGRPADDASGTDDDAGADTDEGSPDEGAAAGTGPSTATVTLGDQTYEFSTEGAVVAQCRTDLFGIFSVQLPGVGNGGSVQIVVLRDGTDPDVVGEVNSIEVTVGDDDWVADEASELFTMFEELAPGMSQVDSAEIDGSTVRGTATFVRQLGLFTGEVETVTGTFEATCGEERIS